MALLPPVALGLHPGARGGVWTPSPSLSTRPAPARGPLRSGHAQPWAQQVPWQRASARPQASGLASAVAENLGVLEREGYTHTLLSREEIHEMSGWPLERLMALAAHVRDLRPDSDIITFSPKVFLPITRLCRDRCTYCVFAVEPPESGAASTPFQAFMSEEEVLELAAQGAELGCTEALFTLGDKPELRYPQAQEELARMGFSSTVEYVGHLARRVMEATGLLPHINAGVMSAAEMRSLRAVSASQGLMLESTAPQLMLPGGPHHECPDKEPHARLGTIRAAGEVRVPFTTGLLVGIGETREQRMHDLMLLRDLMAGPEVPGPVPGQGPGALSSAPRSFGGAGSGQGPIQEVIIQPFRAKLSRPDGPREVPDAFQELLRTVCMARIILGPHANVQSPPNLSASAEEQRLLLEAGINDWGGISPITRDWVNPEAPWPHLHTLAQVCRSVGKELLPRLPIYPALASQIEGRAAWLDPEVERMVLRHSDSHGYARAQSWCPGLLVPPPPAEAPEMQAEASRGAASSRSAEAGSSGRVEDEQAQRRTAKRVPVSEAIAVGAHGLLLTSSPPGANHQPSSTSTYSPSGRSRGNMDAVDAVKGRQAQRVEDILMRIRAGEEASQDDVVALFGARGKSLQAVCQAADELRAQVNGDRVTFVVNRNINYTNMCTYACKFCAFSKGKSNDELRGAPYLMSLDEIRERVREARDRGATEVCMQGGIHPEFTGKTYLSILRAAKRAVPDIHVHAFSPLEVYHGATTLGCSLEEFLRMLRDEGLGSLPGTAAEVLDDRVREVLCPDKLSTQQWIQVMEAAHGVGLRSTSTIMFGSVDSPEHWARHLLLLRETQKRTGGFSEFVPLPFVHMQAPLYAHRQQGRGARKGPLFHECLLMHAVARLVLHPHITNIQASWVKMGPEGARALLNAGCNDMGGTLMNESITRAAGAAHGQELDPSRMTDLVTSLGRKAVQRTTLYDFVASLGVGIS